MLTIMIVTHVTLPYLHIVNLHTSTVNTYKMQQDILYYCSKQTGPVGDPRFCMWLYGPYGSHVEGTVMMCNVASLGGSDAIRDSLLWQYGGMAYVTVETVKEPNVGRFIALFMQLLPCMVIVHVQEMVSLDETSAMQDGARFFSRNTIAQLLASRFIN